ncbi:hypothetical protein E2C01_095503 [Portunus trituberculatus]|uniref:Uncharacterized protein n=1 Tax=Portunus trituberculatus TaxID=210409 RepID=A0A5B7K5Y5_PORTR|nr:hypothetical protein [Portunus trituberculatus]
MAGSLKLYGIIVGLTPGEEPSQGWRLKGRSLYVLPVVPTGGQYFPPGQPVLKQ